MREPIYICLGDEQIDLKVRKDTSFVNSILEFSELELFTVRKYIK